MPTLKIPRYDDNCALCRVVKADKTGSHLAPNFLVHGAFSFDGKGGRFREIVTRDNLNMQSRWLFYGQEVSPAAISVDRGRSLTDEELEGNINVLAYGCGAYVYFPGRRGRFCDEGDCPGPHKYVQRAGSAGQ